MIKLMFQIRTYTNTPKGDLKSDLKARFKLYYVEIPSLFNKSKVITFQGVDRQTKFLGNSNYDLYKFRNTRKTIKGFYVYTLGEMVVINKMTKDFLAKRPNFDLITYIKPNVSLIALESKKTHFYLIIFSISILYFTFVIILVFFIYQSYSSIYLNQQSQ